MFCVLSLLLIAANCQPALSDTSGDDVQTAEVIAQTNDNDSASSNEKDTTDGATKASESRELQAQQDGKLPSVPQTAAAAADPIKQEDNRQQKNLDQKMIESSNQLPGVNIQPDEFHEEEKGFSVGDLNPFKWIFKPVTDMQKRVIHLEKQMMRLEGPIANLQKPMMGLREDMVSVQDKMKLMRGDMGQVRTKMDGLQGNLKGIGGQMTHVDSRIGSVQSQLKQIRGPIVALRDPILDLQKPLSSVGGELQTLKSDLHELKDVVKLTSTLILIAIISVGLIICVGTPIAALFAYRNRRWIMEKFGKVDSREGADPLEKQEDRKPLASSRR